MTIEEKIKKNCYQTKLPYVRASKDKKAFNAFCEDQYRLERVLFCADLAKEFNVADNPKAGLLFAKAWELGHSSGLSEVLNYYIDLVDLIKP